MTNLIPINPAETSIEDDVVHASGGDYFPAMVMRFAIISGTPCAIIQYTDENGEPFSIKDRPEVFNNIVPVSELMKAA